MTCPTLEAGPVAALAPIRAILGGPVREQRFAPYVPHLTVGVFSDTRPTGPIVAALAPFRDLPPIAWRPEAADLVTFAAAGGGPLVTRWRVPFGAGGVHVRRR